MGIKDIALSSNNSPVGIPTPPPLEEILQSGTQSPLSQNPMSGSILKILSENGFKQKIEDGFGKGHRYTLLHSAPSKDFTLIDTWTETKVDEAGNTITVPRKKYQIFTITGADTVTTPAVQATTPEVSLSTEATEPITEPITEPTTPKEVPAVPINTILADIPTTPVTAAESDTSRAKSIAEKIKKGGAGMTPEDWQFRNENWPLIEAELSPKAAAKPAPQRETVTQPEAARQTEAPSQQESAVRPEVTLQPETMATSGAVQKSEPVPVTTSVTEGTPSPAPIPSDQGNPNLVPQHYDSRAWLMKKLKRTPEPISTTTPAVATSTATTSKTSSYDLLKKRFAANTSATAVQPTAQRSSSLESLPDAQTRKKQFIETLFGADTAIWEIVKTIPARAFIYPSEYAWGTDTEGHIIEKTLEDYPLPARKFREKIAQAVEDIGTQGIQIETTPMDEVVNSIFNKGIL